MIRSVGSFVLGYLLIPVVFFVVDGLGHLLAPDSFLGLTLRQVVLLTTTPGTLALLLACDRRRVLNGVAVAVGASIGLVHWYPVFVFFAPGVFWESGGGSAYGSGGTWLFMYLFNLVVPVYTMICATYDATLYTLPLCILGLGLVAWRHGQKKPSSEAGLTTAST